MPMIDDVAIPSGATADAARAAIALHAWNWFYAHANDELIRRKLLFWQVAIYVRDLFPLFVKLFGEPDR